ncbi:ArsR/SmtB family transcription factor [Halorarius halobius]|uniref:ArsR/SmtB family transcription factor n=1 Tax=Halorarius halobius TaxID=2962671 RepID=UPI0020CC408F|nr:helix-turn-helix domain-containing protein [Halorarius halobius]
MSELLPSQSEASPEQNGELQALWLDSDDAGELLSSLSSDTARNILTALHDEPQTASEVADGVDTSLQNARHHLGNLQEAGLVRVAETRYSSKGREMNVYAPSEDPMVVFVGNEDATESDGVVDALRDLLPVIGVLALASLLVEWFVTLSSGAATPETIPRFTADFGGSGGLVAPSVPPGLLFLTGGLLVLAGVAAVRRYQA